MVGTAAFFIQSAVEAFVFESGFFTMHSPTDKAQLIAACVCSWYSKSLSSSNIPMTERRWKICEAWPNFDPTFEGKKSDEDYSLAEKTSCGSRFDANELGKLPHLCGSLGDVAGTSILKRLDNDFSETRNQGSIFCLVIGYADCSPS